MTGNLAESFDSNFSALDSKTASELEQSLINSLLNNINNYNLDINTNFVGVKSALASVAEALYKEFGKVALLIDEYDYPILHSLHSPELAIKIREVVKDFSTAIKAHQAKINFVFVTGVSAFSKSGLSSELNNLKNLTMDESFFDICGYTDLEVDHYFKSHIEAWSSAKKIPYEEIRKDLRTWYNGYCFIENTSTIYSPFSLTCSIDLKKLQNFWFESATPQVLIDELKKEERREECDLLELDKLRGTGDLLQTFEIENLPLTALLFQMGYLTIDSYNPLSRNYELKYPNLEVRASLHRHLITILTKKSPISINPLVGDIYGFLVEEKIEEMVKCLSLILSQVPYPLHIENEKFYHALLQTIFFASGVDAQSERLTSIGKMDLVLDVPNLIYIVELKINKSAESGLKQIESQKYYEPFMHKGKPIVALGLSFSRKKASTKEKSQFSVTYALKKIAN